MKSRFLVLGLLAGLVSHGVRAGAVENLLAEYAGAGAGPFRVEAGAALWVRPHPTPAGETRACASCHTRDPTQPGRHVLTGKNLSPLAPAAHPGCLEDRGKIEKWFRRNCSWTLGRECSPQEKGDFLVFLRSFDAP